MINKRKRGQDDDVTIHQKKNVSYNTLRVSVGIFEGNTAPNILHSSTSIQNRSSSFKSQLKADCMVFT